MATINEVISTLLQNLSEARSSADQMSKQLSSEYMNDPVLRLFPVPRTEIRDVQIELKFGIREVKPRKDIEVNKQARKDALIQKTAEDYLQMLSEELEKESERKTELKEAIGLLDSIRFRDRVREDISAKLAKEIALPSAGGTSFTDKQIKPIFHIEPHFAASLPVKNVLDFELVRDAEGRVSFSVEDKKKKIRFFSNQKFDDESLALKELMNVISSGTTRANYIVEPAKEDPGKARISIRSGQQVIAKSELIDAGKEKIDQETSTKLKTDFVINGGLIDMLRGVKRRKEFEEITRSGTVPVTSEFQIESAVDKAYSRVIGDFRAEMNRISSGVFDYQIETAVEAEALSTIPENAISTIRIDAGISNFQWTRILREDGTETRKLIED